MPFALAGLVMATPGLASASSAPVSHKTAPWASSSHQTTKPEAPIALEPVPPAKAYILVDLNTGNVLAAYHEHEDLRPGSLTKVLTALIAATYLSPHATVPGTKQSWNVYPDKVGIQPGVKWPLDDVLQSLLVMSANDAAYALAQHIGGSLAAFGPIMERSAAQLGMTDHPIFHDPAGLDGSEGVDGGNYVSARDLAIAGRDLLNVPSLAGMVKEKSYTFVDPTGARHWLASANYDFLTGQPGAIGVKTGFTDRAGFCVMGAAVKNGRTMLAVVLDGYNSDQTAEDLIDQGFQTPVADEATSDRLPAFALPRPPAAPPVHALAKASGGHRTVSPGQVAGTDHGVRGSARRHSGAVPPPASRGGREQPSTSAGRPLAHSGSRTGLIAVAATLPGTILLLSAATACLVGLAEYLKLSRLRRAQPLNLEPTARTMAWVTTLGGSRRHRDDLVASYTRHERNPDRRLVNR